MLQCAHLPLGILTIHQKTTALGGWDGAKENHSPARSSIISSWLLPPLHLRAAIPTWTQRSLSRAALTKEQVSETSISHYLEETISALDYDRGLVRRASLLGTKASGSCTLGKGTDHNMHFRKNSLRRASLQSISFNIYLEQAW